MKIQTPHITKKQLQNTRDQKSTNVSKDVAFKGAADIAVQQALNFLDTNQAWGANFVDLAFMVVPRTAVDSTRGPEAGLETARREASGTTNHSLVGAYGLGAAYLLAQPLNNKFGVKMHKTFASNNTVAINGQNWNDLAHIKNSDAKLLAYVRKSYEELQGFNPSHPSQTDGYVGIPAKTQHKAIIKTFKEIKAGFAAEHKTSKNANMSNEAHSYLTTLIGSSVESESQFKIRGGELSEELPLDAAIKNIYQSGKMFMKEKVGEAFAETTKLADNKFINGWKGLNTRTSLLGLGVATAIGCSIQPFNMYLTKKKTGKSGFVGGNGEDRKPDHSAKFKLMKAGATAAFGALVLSTIGNPKKILQKIQFQGFTPTINQFKAVYGMTIMSRFVVARDKDELREATTKDTLGFVNWMILGSFVKTGVAIALEKHAKLGDFLRHDEATQGKSIFKKITKASLISRKEVLFNALNDLGVSTVNKGKALSYKEMVNALPKGHPALKKIKLLA